MQILYKKTSSKKLFFLGGLGALVIVGAVGMFALEFKQNAYATPTCTSIYQPIPSWLITRINNNKSVYQQVASETGVPWAVMAAVHFREFNNEATVNPSNGQGIYQLYSVYYSEDPIERAKYRELAKPGPVSASNFLKQTRYAAEFLQGKAQLVSTPKVKARKLTAGEANMDLIKNTLFSYNGRATVYANQAASLGFDKDVYPYEGSPYVMNQFDCYRESMGLITYDGGNTLTAKDTRMGAFTLYARLRGDAFWKNLQATSMQAASRIIPHAIKPISDKSGDFAIVGFSLSRKPSHAVTLKYTASSPSNAKTTTSYVKILPSNWNNPSRNTIHIQGLDNPDLSGTFEYQLVPTASPSTSDEGFKSVSKSQVPVVDLLQQDVTTTNSVYRLYSETLKKHTYTASDIEKNSLINEGWRDEGRRFSYCEGGNATVARMYNPTTDEYRLAEVGSSQHMTNAEEDFQQMKLDFGVSSLGDVPVYWRYDPVNNRSLYTTSKTEATSAPWQDMGVVFTACSSEARPVFRLFRPSNTSHFYTTSRTERNSIVASDQYRYEGTSFYTCSSGTEPVYRLYRRSNNAHFYTSSNTERRDIMKNQYRDEGVKFYLCDDASRDVYRLFRSNTLSHFYTVSPTERSSLSESGLYRDEGVKLQAK